MEGRQSLSASDVMFWNRPRVVVVSAPLLSEEDLIKAYSIPATDRQFQATMQIIEEHIQEAHEKAELSSSNRELPHFYNGGAEWSGRIRDRIHALRKIASERSRR